MVVPGTYTVECDSGGLLEIFKTEVEMKFFTFKCLKLEIGNVTIKYIMTYYEMIVFYSVVLLYKNGGDWEGAYFKFLLEKGGLLEREA